jgi:hypothetical protein
MVLAIYTNGDPPSTTHPRKRLTGTAHRGPHWVNAVHVLRAAVLNAREHADPVKCPTADGVGTAIIDSIGELDHRGLHVLAVVNAALVRAARRD